MQNRRYVKNFSFLEDTACYCGSQQPFSLCCGPKSKKRKVPNGISIVNEFLSAPQINNLIRWAEKQKRSWLTTIDLEKSMAGKTIQKKDAGRVTQTVALGTRQAKINSLLHKAYANEITPRSGLQIESFEPASMLRYGPGGKYGAHADAEQDDEHGVFYKVLDRDISLLLYLNDNYEGGELKFTHLNYTYKPKAGDLVFFPSNHIFTHESTPLTVGVKWAIVSWAKLTQSVPLPDSIKRISL